MLLVRPELCAVWNFKNEGSDDCSNDCIQMGFDGTITSWNEQDCDLTQGFVCGYCATPTEGPSGWVYTNAWHSSPGAVVLRSAGDTSRHEDCLSVAMPQVEQAEGVCGLLWSPAAVSSTGMIPSSPSRLRPTLDLKGSPGFCAARVHDRHRLGDES